MVGTFDAGLTTTDSFRFTPAGDLSHASWTDQNVLLGLSTAVHLGSSVYKAAKNEFSSFKPSPAKPVEALPSPPVLTIEIVVPGPDGDRFLVYRNEMPDALKQILQRWRAATPLQAAASGRYVWAIPALLDSGPEDLTISTAGRHAALQTGVMEALAGPYLVVPSVGDLNDFLVGGRNYRSRFIARLEHGFAYFGILAAP